LQVRLLDLSSMAGIRTFAEEWKLRGGPVHVLINNAGVFNMGGKQSSSDDLFMQVPKPDASWLVVVVMEVGGLPEANRSLQS
jgi:NAD(P)-dependent dehydrogenase (short-subunit alcohol dehydrogenase family)